MAVERRIKVIERKDSKARLFIIERDDGRYRFEGEAQVDDQDGLGPYYSPCYISGLYASADDAEQAAYRDVLWLKDQIPS